MCPSQPEPGFAEPLARRPPLVLPAPSSLPRHRLLRPLPKSGGQSAGGRSLSRHPARHRAPSPATSRSPHAASGLRAVAGPRRPRGRRCPLCPTACVPPGPAAASKTSFLDTAAAARWGLAGGRGVLPSRQRACRADLQKRRSPHPRAAAQLPECAGRQALDARHSHSAISDTGNKTFLDHPKTTRVSPKYHETCLRNYATIHQRFLENANRELCHHLISGHAACTTQGPCTDQARVPLSASDIPAP